MPSLEAELRSLELYKKKYAVNPSKALESIIKRQEERVKNARGNETRSSKPASPISPGVCVKRYVTIKEGCNSVRRVVHKNDTTNKNYVQINGKNVYLSSIRGKYRYSDI